MTDGPVTDASVQLAPPAAKRSIPQAPSNAAVRFGLALFAVGVIVIVVAVIGFFLGVHNWPLWVNVCCGAFAPAGMVIAIVGALQAGRRDQRTALRAVQQQ
jgi:hypothetical protein